MSTFSLQKSNYMEKARPVLHETGKILKQTVLQAGIDVLTHHRPGEGIKGKAIRFVVQVGKYALVNVTHRVLNQQTEKGVTAFVKA